MNPTLFHFPYVLLTVWRHFCTTFLMQFGAEPPSTPDSPESFGQVTGRFYGYFRGHAVEPLHMSGMSLQRP